MYGEWVRIGVLKVWVNCTPDTPEEDKLQRAKNILKVWVEDGCPANTWYAGIRNVKGWNDV